MPATNHRPRKMKVDPMTEEPDTEEVLPKIAGRQIVVPTRLSEPKRAELSRQLYKVHQRIFAGVSAEGFRRHVVDAPAESTVIQLYLASDGQVVGYCALHRFRRRVRGRNAIVLRAEAGLLPEYRGRGAAYGFGMIRAAAERIRHPFTPIYYLGTLVHASSYHLFCKYFSRVFPHPAQQTPTDMQEIACELADGFPDPPVAQSDPLVRDVGWVTIETPQEKALNRRGDRADVQFFKARNPGYTEGHGLVVVVPITFGNLVTALVSRLLELARIALCRRQTGL